MKRLEKVVEANPFPYESACGLKQEMNVFNVALNRRSESLENSLNGILVYASSKYGIYV